VLLLPQNIRNFIIASLPNDVKEKSAFFQSFLLAGSEKSQAPSRFLADGARMVILR